MKTFLLSCIALATLLTIPGCTTVEQRRPPSVQSTTTTTEQSSYRQPMGGSTETRTTRYN